MHITMQKMIKRSTKTPPVYAAIVIMSTELSVFGSSSSSSLSTVTRPSIGDFCTSVSVLLLLESVGVPSSAGVDWVEVVSAGVVPVCASFVEEST